MAFDEFEPECMTCRHFDVCSLPPGTIVIVTKEMRDSSNCWGSGFDVFDLVTE